MVNNHGDPKSPTDRVVKHPFHPWPNFMAKINGGLCPNHWTKSWDEVWLGFLTPRYDGPGPLGVLDSSLSVGWFILQVAAEKFRCSSDERLSPVPNGFKVDPEWVFFRKRWGVPKRKIRRSKPPTLNLTGIFTYMFTIKLPNVGVYIPYIFCIWEWFLNRILKAGSVIPLIFPNVI